MQKISYIRWKISGNTIYEMREKFLDGDSVEKSTYPISRSCQLVFLIVIIVHSPGTALLHGTFDRIFRSSLCRILSILAIRDISRRFELKFQSSANRSLPNTSCSLQASVSPPLSLSPRISKLLQPRYLPLDLEHFETNVPIFLTPEITSYSSLTDLSTKFM